MQPSISIRRRALWVTAGVVWLGAVVAGLASLARYDNRPGTAAHPVALWPADSRIARAPARFTLVMLAHPRCDCTKASVAELAELMARAHARPKAYVVFIKPGSVAGGWEKTDLWAAASHIPDVTVVRDDDGFEARAFGAETSGQVFLYDPNGGLVFSGGDTGSRGHAGDNLGRATILAWLNGETPDRTGTPVFGCSLFASPEEMRAQEAMNHGTHR
jgi:hypothetical protein